MGTGGGKKILLPGSFCAVPKYFNQCRYNRDFSGFIFLWAQMGGNSQMPKYYVKEGNNRDFFRVHICTDDG